MGFWTAFGTIGSTSSTMDGRKRYECQNPIYNKNNHYCVNQPKYNSHVWYSARNPDYTELKNMKYHTADNTNLKKLMGDGGQLKQNGTYKEKYCTKNGIDYEGIMDFTITGAKCANWNNLEWSGGRIKTSNAKDRKFPVNYCRMSQNNHSENGLHSQRNNLQRPWCYMRTDRLGHDTAIGTTTLWKDALQENYPHAFPHNKGDKGGYITSFMPLPSKNNKSLFHSNKDWYAKDVPDTMGQRCWVGDPLYSRWDCHNIQTNEGGGDESHGITNEFENKLLDVSVLTKPYINIKSVTSSGADQFPRKMFTDEQLGMTADIRTKLEGDIPAYKRPWQALARSTLIAKIHNYKDMHNGYKIAKDIISKNNQEHWIRIVLPKPTFLHSINIMDAISAKQDPPKTVIHTAAPLTITYYEDPFTTSVPYAHVTTQANADPITYQKIDYGKIAFGPTTFSKNDMLKGNVYDIVNKRVSVILIQFIRENHIYENTFGIHQIELLSISNNYKVMYSKDTGQFIISDSSKYNNYSESLLSSTPSPIIKEHPSGNTIQFKANLSYKLETKLQMTDNVGIQCWIKLPLEQTDNYHTLISNDTNNYKPIVVDKDQNRLGCIIGANNTFHPSKIVLGELKIGWHLLYVIITKGTTDNTPNVTIKYYINGHEADVITKPFPNTIDANIYSIGNSVDGGEPWGIISNLDLNCNLLYLEKNDNVVSPDINNPDWKQSTCPNHSKVIKQAVNTAKTTASIANKHKLEKIKKQFKKNTQYARQKAEDIAYQAILNEIAADDNVIIWNNVNTFGNKIKLVSAHKASNGKFVNTDIGIRNIQVYGTYDNVDKDWITDNAVEVKLSSQPKLGKNKIDLISSKKYISSLSNDDEIDITNNKVYVDQKCKSDNEYLLSCKCLSTDSSCDGSRIILDPEYLINNEANDKDKAPKVCRAYRKGSGTNVKAQSICGTFKGDLKHSNFNIHDGSDSPTGCDPLGDNDHNTNYLLNCSAYSTTVNNSGIDGTEIIEDDSDGTKQFRCNAIKSDGITSNITTQSYCMNVPGDKSLKAHSQRVRTTTNKSKTENDAPISLSCPMDYSIIDGSCLSRGNNDCDSAEIDVNNNKVTAFNKQYGDGVHASYNCMKFNTINDNCIDGSLDTECRTGQQSKLPSITFLFNKKIFIKKIVIYNRAKKKENNYPLKINILDEFNHIILTGSKENSLDPIQIENKPPEPPDGCKNFEQLNITDKGFALKSENDISNGGLPEFRQWADIRGIGKNCDYCRVIGSDNKRVLSCALGDNSYNQYAYNSAVNFNNTTDSNIMNGTEYMYHESNDAKDDFCYLKKVDNKTTIECLKNTSNGFGEKFIPSDQDSNYNGLSGSAIKQYRMPFDTSQCILNTYSDNYESQKVNAGFYWKSVGKYFLFKNSILDSTNVILFLEYDAFTDKNIHESPLIVNNKNWTGLSSLIDKIDATLYVDVDDMGGDVEYVYFFSGEKIIKYDLTNNEIIENNENDTLSNTTDFAGLYGAGFTSIDCACYLGDGLCLFFKDNQYITYNLKESDSNNRFTTPSLIRGSSTFKDLPFEQNIDNIIYMYNFNKKPMLFYKNDERIEYNYESKKVNLTNNIDITMNKWNIDDIGKVFSSERTKYNNNLYINSISVVNEKTKNNTLFRSIDL